MELDPRIQDLGPSHIEGVAPAKLNLFLEVTHRREDGYHELVTVFHEIDLVDELRLEFLAPDRADELQVLGLPIQGAAADNLALRALRAFRARVPGVPPTRIVLKKNIPCGAGLGGGSSDAAFVLRALQSFFSTPLSGDELRDQARGLGADVPFFLVGGTAIGTGRGDQIEALPGRENYCFLLARPDFSLSTARVYDHLHLTRQPREVMPFLRLYKECDGGGALDCFNRLEEAAFHLSPRLQSLRESLDDRLGRPWTLTGSGSVLFTSFRSESVARQALCALSDWDETPLDLVRSFSSRMAKDPP
jgi:4-diphosphocytidyl-2-C-methyl-D-erythritol kinase